MGANRNIKYIKGLLGDKSLDNYTSSDEASFRDYLLKNINRKLFKRNFSTIITILNYLILYK